MSKTRVSIRQLREWTALANDLGGGLLMHYSGTVFIDRIEEATNTDTGAVRIGDVLMFVDDAERGEEWEEFSETRGRTLRDPVIVIDGEEFAIEKALEMRRDGLVAAGD